MLPVLRRSASVGARFQRASHGHRWKRKITHHFGETRAIAGERFASGASAFTRINSFTSGFKCKDQPPQKQAKKGLEQKEAK
jgi:hypothetical protein